MKYFQQFLKNPIMANSKTFKSTWSYTMSELAAKCGSRWRHRRWGYPVLVGAMFVVIVPVTAFAQSVFFMIKLLNGDTMVYIAKQRSDLWTYFLDFLIQIRHAYLLFSTEMRKNVRSSFPKQYKVMQGMDYSHSSRSLAALKT